ncbi:MAG: tRNA (N6-threonylcarbamoyladenosine(37)-N6)-methyltransferase TrmO [Clostridia bacterium]|nr:tRNA (N6-threonylcarbamoyladenosine(37)-N6)-methyltransferase TrmO [Clostridia bacterium]
MKIIAHIKTDFPTKFGVPRQSGLIKSAVGKIVFEKEYRDVSAFRGIEEFSHIWVLWKFSKSSAEKWSPTVRPPMLGGNVRMGVFATRSPYRPNPIGMSALKLESIEYTDDFGPVLIVSGCDMIDGTPVFDIKPYLAYTDSISDATGGFTEHLKDRTLRVDFPDDLIKKIPSYMRGTVLEILESDPRPSYQNDAERIYGFEFGKFEIKFKVSGKNLTVISTEKSIS